MSSLAEFARKPSACWHQTLLALPTRKGTRFTAMTTRSLLVCVVWHQPRAGTDHRYLWHRQNSCRGSHDTLIEICCVAGMCRIVMMSYFLGYDATSENAFYFVGYSKPELVFSLPEADVCIAVIVLTDVKPYKKLPYRCGTRNLLTQSSTGRFYTMPYNVHLTD
jgi:hypothetical protein